VQPASPKPLLDLAARAALRAAGDVEPNPMVGAVIVKGDRIIGIGHHRKFGGLHAEREALADCRRRGEDPRGSTIYVTLEPCCHHGKQPPCTDALIEAGITRVIAARRDPNPVSANGAEVLHRAGIICEFTDASPLATRLSDPFIKRITTGLPWVIAKWAQTIDGRIATRTGESRWISGEVSRRRVHHLRARVDCILTGMGTVIADDPLLTARGIGRVRRVARRVVIDSDLDIPVIAQLVRTAREFPTTVVCSDQAAAATASGPRREALKAAGVEILPVPLLERGIDLNAALSLSPRTTMPPTSCWKPAPVSSAPCSTSTLSMRPSSTSRPWSSRTISPSPWQRAASPRLFPTHDASNSFGPGAAAKTSSSRIAAGPFDNHAFLLLQEKEAVLHRGLDPIAIRCDLATPSLLMRAGLDGREADRRCAEHRAERRAGHGSDGIGVRRIGPPHVSAGHRLRTGFRQQLRINFASDADQRALRMAAALHAGDDFLPEVAPLLEVHTIGEDTCFVRERVRPEVDVVERPARFDARDVEGVPARGAEPVP
jgi:diaminohydroxyphosphoribosylaminopyrimidine deaminase/5-amino-6-(5-phosphoribosylamino)uracil reductase